MAFESLQSYMYIGLDISALLAAVFACMLVYRLWKKEYRPSIKHRLVVVFALLAIGEVLNVAGEILYGILYEFTGKLPTSGIPDIIWVIGYISSLLGYAYFSIYMYKEHRQLRKGLGIMGISAVILTIIVLYISKNYIFNLEDGALEFGAVLDCIYLVLSALVVLFSINVYIFFIKLEYLGTPLMYLAIANLLTFVSDNIYIYYSWMDVYGMLGVLSDSLYIFTYLIAALAFYVLYRRIKIT